MRYSLLVCGLANLTGSKKMGMLMRTGQGHANVVWILDAELERVAGHAWRRRSVTSEMITCLCSDT
jgi:hypothetical protein